MPKNISLSQPNFLAEEKAAEMAASFLRDLLHVSSKLNHLKRTYEGSAKVSPDWNELQDHIDFGHQLWQLSGYRRYAEIQIKRLRSLLNAALIAYPCPQSRIDALNEIHGQIVRTESALREARLFWRELSATYHFMLGANRILAVVRKS